MMPSLSLLRTILTWQSRVTTCKSRIPIFFAPKREHPRAVSLAAWFREPLEAESAASAAERLEQAREELRAVQAAREAALPDWSSPRSVPARRWNLSIRPSTE